MKIYILLYYTLHSTDAVFALMWRFRACYEPEMVEPPFEFNIAKFLPRDEPLVSLTFFLHFT